MSILGLDPSTRTGVAHSDGVFATWPSVKGHRGARLVEFSKRLRQLHSSFPFSRICVEGPAFGNHNQAVALHIQMVGVVWQVAHRLGDLPVTVVAPASLKKWATGNGHAKKPDVLAAARKLDPRIADSDQADAFWAMHMLANGWTKGAVFDLTKGAANATLSDATGGGSDPLPF